SHSQSRTSSSYPLESSVAFQAGRDHKQSFGEGPGSTFSNRCRDTRGLKEIETFRGDIEIFHSQRIHGIFIVFDESSNRAHHRGEKAFAHWSAVGGVHSGSACCGPA